MDMSQYRDLFVAEAREHLARMGDNVLALEKDPAHAELIDSLFRNAHSIKGMAASMDYPGIADLAHKMEELIDRVRKGTSVFDGEAADLLFAGIDHLGRLVGDVAEGRSGSGDYGELGSRLLAHGIVSTGGSERRLPAGGETASPAHQPPPRTEAGEPAPEVEDGQRTVRVKADLLDRLISITGELITSKNRLVDLGMELASEKLSEATGALARQVRELHNEVMAVRMLPFATICERLPRMVRDLSRKYDKQVSLVIEGKENRLDRGILEVLADPLVHILRNAVDHGIELPAERVAAGKSGEGRIVLSVRREQDHIVVAVEDDGRGMDSGALVAAALAKGLISEEAGAALSPQEALMLTCLPGFSTAAAVTEISGRGVGMDAVQAAIRQIGGVVSIHSAKGEGSRIQLKLPLTVAIIQVLLLACSTMTLAVPVTAVQRTVEFDRRALTCEGDRLFADIGGETVPLVGLDRLLGLSPGADAGEVVSLLLIDRGEDMVGVMAERVLGQAEVFVKPLGRPLAKLKGLAGGAILGDGRVIFILDLPNLLEPLRWQRFVAGSGAGDEKGGIR